MTQYRNSVSDSNCQSPTSPHSVNSYSPSQSPGAVPNNHAVDNSFSDAYYIQQQQQQQTNALQHQFEQFNMAAMLAMSSSDDFFQPHFLGSIDVMALGQSDGQSTMSSPSHGRYMNQQTSQSSLTSGSKIPDIILTGADDLCRFPLDFARELGNAITGMSDSFDTDFLTNDEAFKAGLDPLDLEEIQMLTDASLVADPATEDSFKRDRL
jgi:CREB-regulated transcription coactivator 1